MQKTKCALRKEQEMWLNLEEIINKWTIENYQNGLINTRNSLGLYAVKWVKINKEDGTNFEASLSWCARFYNQKLPSTSSKVENFTETTNLEKMQNFQIFVSKKGL